MTHDTTGLDKLDPTNMTAAELYAALKEHGELIVTIPCGTLAKMKQDLANYKTRRSMADKALRLSYKILLTQKVRYIKEGGVDVPLQDVQINLKGADLLPIYDVKRPSEL